MIYEVEDVPWIIEWSTINYQPLIRKVTSVWNYDIVQSYENWLAKTDWC